MNYKRGCIVVFLVVAVVGIFCAFYFINNDSEDMLGKIKEQAYMTYGMEYYRLPKYIKPIQQFVRLQPYFPGNNTILGYTALTIEFLKPSVTIALHMVDIITNNDTIKLVKAGDPSQHFEFSNHTYDPERSFYIAHLSKELPVGVYILSMEFEGFLNNNLLGFYRTSYSDENDNNVHIAVSQFAAIEARRAFPCFDEPSMKCKFKIEMIRERHMRTLSNMPRTSTKQLSDQPGWFSDEFDVSVPMSTYLVAFIISDFIHLNSTENDHVLFRVWTQKVAIESTKYALDIGPKILTFYEGYYEIPFPLPKQDMVAVPDFYYGAMENWGLVIYRGSRLLYRADGSSAKAKQSVCAVVAHELAHQWFGNLVTNSWWNDVWLNEGFATLIECYGCNYVEPTFGMLDQFLISDLHVALEVDAMETSHALNFPIEQPSDIGRIYDTITYSKGASILHMIQHFITEESFQRGLVNYLKEFSYSNAKRDDLWHHLTNQSHNDGTLAKHLSIKELMDPWALQVGYPLLTVSREENGDILLTQSKFSVGNNTSSTHEGASSWAIPLTYTSQDEADFSYTQVMEWMHSDERTKIIEDISPTSKWVIFNIQQNAYYRVNYDTNIWNAIVDQMISDHSIIHMRNRAQILNDVYSLAKAGLTSYDVALGINSYLNNEEEFVPLKVALKQLKYLQNMFSQESGYSALKDYLLSLLVPLYDSVGFEDDLEDPHLTQLKRSLICTWSCDLGYGNCINNSKILYAEWMAQPKNHTIISPNLKDAVYCTGIADGGKNEWEFAFNQYKITTTDEKEILLTSLGCSKDTELLERYISLAFTVDGGVRKQDVPKVVSSVAQNPLGEDLTWNYILDNAHNIANYMGSFSYVGTYVDEASKNFNTKEELKKLKQFKADYAAILGSSTKDVDQAIERTINNINWMNSYYNSILGWLSINWFNVV